MNLVRWNPWRDLDDLQNQVGHFFYDPFARIDKGKDDKGMSHWNPAVDIFNKDEMLVIKAELPGVHKEDITIDVKEQVLTLEGERSFDHETKEDAYYRKERSFGKFHRVFRLPSDIDADKIKADFINGVLEISIPKTEEKKSRKITVH